MTYIAHVPLIPLDIGAFSLGHPAGNRDLSRSPNDRPLLTPMSVTSDRPHFSGRSWVTDSPKEQI